MNFVRFFNKEEDAIHFAENHNSKVIIRYDWDDLYGIIRYYEVSY